MNDTGTVTAETIEAFTRAVNAGDRKRLRALFAEHPGLAGEIDSPRFDAEWPAIVLAANRADRQLVDLLLKFGADVNARSQFWGRTIGVFDRRSARRRRQSVKGAGTRHPPFSVLGAYRRRTIRRDFE